MTTFRMGRGRAADGLAAAALCAAEIGTPPAGANLGFVYVGDALAGDFAAIVAHLRQRTGVTEWIGTVGIGVCGTGTAYFAEPAVVAMVGAFPPGSFRLFDGSPSGGGAAFGVVHADPRHRDCVDGIASVAAETGGFLVGAFASSRGEFHILAGAEANGGVSGALFGDGVAVATGVTQGCTAIGAKRAVTQARDNLVVMIDGMPAVEALARDMAAAGITGTKGTAESLHVAFPIAGSDTGDYLVRNLLGVDPESGALAVGQNVTNGDVIQFCKRDADAARQDLGRMLGRLRRRAKAPKAALYFTCLARGPNLFDGASEELTMIADALGEVPLVGFFGNGEISAGRVYTYTGVLAVFL